MPSHKPSPLRGAAAGLAAGLIASLAMDLFQKGWSRVVDMPKGGDPATVKAAQRGSRALTGEYLAEEDKQAAGQVVHYLFGAGLGAAYGLTAEFRPSVTSGFGTLSALGTATLFDEAAVPAAGLSEAPIEFPPRSHAYSYASHLVFGVVTEGMRRLLRAGD